MSLPANVKSQPSQAAGVVAARYAPSRKGSTRVRRTASARTGRVTPGAVLHANTRPSEWAAVESGYTDPLTGLAREDDAA